MSPQPLPGRHSPPLLALAGCCSALLTVGIDSSPGYLNQYYVAPGVSFGLFIPLYFALYERASSAWRLLTFLLTSIAASEASICAAFLIRIVLPQNLNDPVTGPSAFAGGLVGGFIVLMAGSILFGRSRDNPAVPGVLAASLATGALGVAGWSADRVLGPFILRLIKAIPGLWVPPVRDSLGLNWPESVSLYIIWQTGTALLLGWLVAAERAPSVPGSLPLTVAPLRPHASRTKIAFAGLFFCAVLGFLGWFFVRDLQLKRLVEHSDQEFKTAEARRDEVFKQYVAEAPPVAGLPPIQALGTQHALILGDVAGFRAENPSARPCSQQPLFNGAVPEPPCMIYEAYYTLLNQPDPLPRFYPVRISVMLTQYPDTAWARYRGRGYVAPLDNPQPVTLTSATRTDRIMRKTSESGGGTDASYAWPSGSIVVHVNGSTLILTVDFLRQYLAKYPSSL